ncbi:MAG: hypothetical protein ACXACW_03960 [Candidatus Hodarchaeales archaeon]
MKRLENIKKSIGTILDQFPKFLEPYDHEDQLLIKIFLELLTYIEEAEHNRANLSNRFVEYRELSFAHQRYFTTQFLWLTKSIAEEAIYHLSISRFYPLDFYNFVLYQIRQVFQLIRQTIPLNHQLFEDQQEKLKPLYSPLTPDEVELLKLFQSILRKGGIESLNAKTIRNEVLHNTAVPSKMKRETEISRFQTLIEGKWWLLFQSLVFGLTRVFFHLNVGKNQTLENLFELSNPVNTTLGRSDVYKIWGSEAEFVGTFLVPTIDLNLLERLLKQYEREGKLVVKKLVPIRMRKRTISITNYKAKYGWKNLTKKGEQAIVSLIKPVKQVKNIISDLELFLDPLILPNWHINEADSPSSIVELYCKTPSEYTYPNLPYTFLPKKKKNILTRSEITIMTQLFEKSVIDIGFVPWRLIDEYSRNLYCVEIPPLPYSTLIPFLEILPYADSYFSEKNHFLLARLSPQMVQWIQKSLKWKTFSLQRLHFATELKSDWFNSKTMEWTKPLILQK